MKKTMYMLGIATIMGLSGCGSDAVEEETNHEEMNHSESPEEASHEEMNHSGSAKVPEGLKEAENPAFKIGTQAIIQDGHMEGMKDAEATIAGAYDTTVYTLSYTPTTGGERVTNHKWIIHEEIKDAGEQPIEPGTEVILDADHMGGMKGAKAVIESAEQTTVYMVDYTPTNGGEKVTNHQWVTESELSAK
ncbi:YdhK family protein [Domibacillus sp. DTU_2020_1001157_1_SI_ALB_TIR_016]|uniref:YdhK family protein n=1 Tax=Domibacillus sp. DTU_2020_1001157_1_SI_ALB_TIR_016 TaxID=3077789 RepID=UPI0028F09967|nr:YdhK family protein [Domibacillus sp. DTU_2020_1001157_1_SI_ALB_TIR_016]WNS77896.1 YdhK family protein [Domibacillus sp. DTU_2020_1001157_1_SI_ALB_TIR_016]